MTSQEQLAKIGQAALDAKTEGLGLPPRVAEAIRVAGESEVSVPIAPGLYLMQRAGAPDRTGLLDETGAWHMDSLRAHYSDKSPAQMQDYLLASGRRLERVYTAVEAQKLAADAVNLSERKLSRVVDADADAEWRRKGQLDIIGYIESIHRYPILVNELVQATAPGGIIHVKVNG